MQLTIKLPTKQQLSHFFFPKTPIERLGFIVRILAFCALWVGSLLLIDINQLFGYEYVSQDMRGWAFLASFVFVMFPMIIASIVTYYRRIQSITDNDALCVVTTIFAILFTWISFVVLALWPPMAMQRVEKAI